MRASLVFLLIVTAFNLEVFTQTCQPPEIVVNSNTANIFSPEQEMILGDLVVERSISEYREINDPGLLAYINKIGENLIRHLPKTGLTYHFHIIDLNDTNAFNLPGGHVFISRKIISFVNNEDELAGIMAHELGHATVHHGAISTSEEFKRVLNVTSVGDRKDITEKYNRLIENYRTKKSAQSRNHSDTEQLQADRIGIFALVAAGYDPESFFGFFDRLTDSKGKTGSWISELFGTTNPEEKRLREVAKAASSLPKECRDGRSAKASDEFLAWQAGTIMFRETDRKEEIAGLLWKKEISPKLQSDVTFIDVSSDGKLVLAQTDYSINVIDRVGSKVLLQIPVEGADNAELTPDDRYVVFTTPDLRFERWDISQAKAVEVRELYLKRSCWEHALSPDGNYLACIDAATTLNVVETKTGKKVWEKKSFYELSPFEYLLWLLRSGSADEQNLSLFRIQFTPDSRFAVFSRTNKFRFTFRINMVAVADSENTAAALDLSTMKTVDIGGDIKKVTSRPYAFIDSGRIIGSTEAKLEAGGIFSFPAGKKLEKLTFGAEEVKRTANNNYVILRPLASGTTGIFDISRNAIVAAIDRKDLTVWGNIVAFESAGGKILFRDSTYNETSKLLEGKDVDTIELPVAAISRLNVAEVSDDMSWLLVSSKTRGGVWNLQTGDRKIFTRGFKGGVIDSRGVGVAEFPPMDRDRHSLAVLNGADASISTYKELSTPGAKQYRRFLLTRKSLKEKSENDTNGPGLTALKADEKFELGMRDDVNFAIKDWITDKVIWTHDFNGKVPRYSFDAYSGRLILYWRLATDEGKARLAESRELSKQADELGDKLDDYMIEVIDAFAEKTIGKMLLETGKGSFSVYYGSSEGNWLAVNDSEGRVLVYSLNDGTLRHRFFGTRAVLSPSRDMIAIVNNSGDVSLYGLLDGERKERYRLNGNPIFVRFNLKSDRLFLLSDRQVGYAIDLQKLGVPVRAGID
ncbi:hypothetical protein BH10ACI3_BH10ACI3_16440 [soil metagenome]